MWLKAHGRLPLIRIITAYRAQVQLDDDAPLVLKVDGLSYPDDTLVSQIPVRDRFLIMSAHIEQQSASQQSTARTQSSRAPLQPVSRQLTVPPVNASPDQHAKAATPALSASPAAALPSPTSVNASTLVETARSVSRQPSAAPQCHSLTVDTALQMAPSLPTQTPGQQQQVKSESPASNIDTSAELRDVAPSAEEQEQETQYEPRDQGNPFTAFPNADDVEHLRGQKLQQLAAETLPERLEAGVVAGLEVLDSIQHKLEQLGDHEDAVNWRKQIEKVRKDASKTRTVVGVVGNTGAGKSSVINAMLEEERLVPTNCMRACTAVVTELSWNESTNPRMKYRAVIEFINPEDWEKELHVLFKEMFDESGNLSREIANPDSEAGVAYAKVRAVYHKHTREMLANTTVASLMNQKHVKNILGKVRTIREAKPDAFYTQLQQYVDSKEKIKLDKNGKPITNPKREQELWPLIRVVKIYTKADALSTGACIVDLPGVHDSNAARAAVANSYMKECTGLWIVAPINRAVDDKAAKTLLGDTFKRQLKFDGSYSSVTFICSKTDDISRMEASDSLNLGDEYQKLDDKLVEIERRRRALRAELKETQKSKSDYEETIDQVEEEIEKWDELSDQLDQGKTVYPPTQKKRKRAVSNGGSNKRRRRSQTDDSNDENSDQSSSEPQEVAPEQAIEPLTEQAINDKLDELKTMKKDARREKNALNSRIEELKQQIESNSDEIDEMNAQQNALCIAGRNEYSRRAIQQDFAAGIRELDQESAQDEDPDNFNPEDDLRDYEHVAKSLPVFCVSSRAYQKLSGRLAKDSDIEGFRTADETEVPALQAHCRNLTVKGRQATCRRFLNNVQALLTSMGLWASDDGSGVRLTAAQRDAEKAFLARELKKLGTALEKTVTDTLEDAVASLNEQLFEKFEGAVKSAVKDAVPTSAGWGAPRPQGGLFYATYKATVRRSGVFAGAAGHRDFNGELAEPLYKHLATAWEKTFQRRLPNILNSFTESATDVAKKFHAAVEQRVRAKGHGISRIGMIGGQLQTHNAKFADLVANAIETINNGQRDINREFTPVIANAMEPSYTFCIEERGPGTYRRMRDYMEDHVSKRQSTMFHSSSEAVRKALLKLFNGVKEAMLDKADEVYVLMQRDYLTLVGVERGTVRMSREERATRREVDDVIAGADTHFSRVLEADLEDLKARQQQGDAEADAVDEVIAENEMEVDDTDNDDDALTDDADINDAAGEGNNAESEGENVTQSNGGDDD